MTDDVSSTKPSGNVLVMGDDMRIFLALVRAFGRAGKTVHAAPPNPAAPALRSRHVKKVHVLPRYNADAPGPWIAALRLIVQENCIDLVVPCTDVPIILLDRHRAELASIRLAIPPASAMGSLFDKELTHALGKRLGVPMAPSRRLDEADTAAGLAMEFGLPLVIKPRRSCWPDRLDVFDRVHIADTREDIEAALGLVGERNRHLVESWFEGQGGGLSVLATKGEILQAFQHRRLREGRGTASSFRISEGVHQGMHEAIAQICAELEYTGVCMFEFRINDATGAWRLLETNARFWGSMALPIALGVDFPNLLYDLAIHGRRHAAREYRTGIKSRNAALDAFNLFRDMQRGAPNGRMRWAADAIDFALFPLQWMMGREHSDSFALNDPSPAFAEAAAILFTRRQKLADR
jgi:predicted ATP-grasp superfamily ATP-dependent carboligase